MKIKKNSCGIENWNERASVRSAENTYGLPPNIDIELVEKDWFLRSALSFMKHPAILDAGEPAAKRFLARYLIFFLNYTTSLEHKIVNRSVEIIVHDELGLGITFPLKKAGLQLYTDEGYHALIAASVAKEVNDFYGFGGFCLNIQRIDNLQQLIQQESRNQKLALLIVGFVSETSITQELLVIASQNLVSPIYHMMHDHLMDECKHSQYFSTALHFVWSRLSESARDFSADFFIKVIFEFFKMDEQWLKTNLIMEGVDTEAASSISSERQSEFAHISRARSGSKATIKALKAIDFFNHKDNLAKFKAAGLIDE